jgi:antitoxin ParD1/3/4
MDVSLTPEMERWVASKLEAGRYSSASEAVGEGLRLLQEKDAEEARRLEALRRDIQLGADSLDRGERVDGEEAFERVLSRIRTAEESAA